MIASSQMSYLARRAKLLAGMEKQRLEMRPVAFFTIASNLLNRKLLSLSLAILYTLVALM
jgi:hypothetical protein